MPLPSFQFAGVSLLKSTVHFTVGVIAGLLAYSFPARVCQLASRDGAGGERRASGFHPFSEFSDAREPESETKCLKGL